MSGPAANTTVDAVLEMPPVPLWYRGNRDYGRFIDRVFQMRGTGWVMTRLTANGQPALAAYAPQPRLLTFPTVVGTGERLLPAGGPPACLETLSVERLGAAVLTRYGRAAR